MLARSIRAALIGVLALPFLVLLACGSDSSQPGATGGLDGELTVFAASSLTDAFSEMGNAFEAAHPDAEVSFNFAGSSVLRTQIQAGAPADVFASANTSHMDVLVEDGLAIDPEIFAHNSLVLITPDQNPGNIGSLADLAEPGLKLVLAAPEVPVGGYAREMLANSDQEPAFGEGFSKAVLENLVSNESNVKQVLAKVQLGEADAGIVYGSDVTPEVAPDLQKIEIPNSVNTVADYPIAMLAESGESEVAAAFVDLALSNKGQEILSRCGFGGVQ